MYSSIIQKYRNYHYHYNYFLFTDEPTPPGKPNIEDWGPNHCDLSWKIPDSDGGAPITDYEIEYMVNF